MDTLSGIAVNGVIIPLNKTLRVNTLDQPASVSAAQVVSPADPATRDSIKVNLSVEGLKAAASAGKSGDSAAVNQAKEIEKIRERIKELEQKIQEQQAQLQAIQGDRHLSSDEKMARVSAVTQQLASLNSSLTSVNAQLMEALKGRPKTGRADAVQPLPYVGHQRPQSESASS